MFVIPLPELPADGDDLFPLDDRERKISLPNALAPRSPIPDQSPDSVPAAKTRPGAGTLWQDIEHELQHSAKSACPKCAAAISAQTVICVSCGYNLQTGQQLPGASTAGIGNRQNGDSFTERLLPTWSPKWQKSAGAISFLVILLFSFLLTLVTPTPVMMASALLMTLGMLMLFLGFILYWPRLLFNEPGRAFLLLTIIAAPLFGYRLMVGNAFGGLPDPKYRVPRILFKFGGLAAGIALALMLVWFLTTSLMQGDLLPGGRPRR